jgi:Flp pilus assembly CpaF family ATPase
MFKRVVDARAHVVVSGMNVLVAGGTQSGKASI